MKGACPSFLLSLNNAHLHDAFIERMNKMSWINVPGLIFVLLLLVPNIAFAAAHKDGFENRYQNKQVEALEQIGRFGCFIFMAVCLPFACGGWWFDKAETVYLTAGGALITLYLLGWFILWKEDSVRKSLLLSIVPSLLFLESGILTLNIPLILAAMLFAPCHITISYQNARLKAADNKR